MALDGAKFICLSKAAAADATETTPASATGDVAGDSAETATAESTVIEAKGRKFTVGYLMNCDYVLDDDRATGVHCEIQCDAFGRVTIHNMSEAHPISVNDQVITIKRPLLDGSRIKILDSTFLWKFPKSVEATATTSNRQMEKNASNENENSATPQKLVEVPEQAPNSCPDLKPHRKMDKRFTVHNFAYCINSDDEGNTSSELPSITESESLEEAATDPDSKNSEASEKMSGLLTEIATQESADVKGIVETMETERRSVSPELEPSVPTIASTPLIKFKDTPKMNLINCTQNKGNQNTEKNRRLLTLCQQSDMLITSFSPRETGVRIEKSFTAILKSTPTGPASTPKSVYSTPKSVISDYNDEGSRDFIDFTTPATSKKNLVGRPFARNSSMHLIDLTTPSKLAPASPRPRSTLKCNKTLPINVKLSTTPLVFDKIKEELEETYDMGLLPATPLAETSSSKSDATPQSAMSVISVDGSTDLSTAVIEVSEDSATPSTSSPLARAGVSSKTPHRTTGQKQQTSTPQSLIKRAILTSAKKKAITPLRKVLTGATPTRQPTTTPARSIKLDESASAGSSYSTPKSPLAVRSSSSKPAAQSCSASARRNLAIPDSALRNEITTSTPLQACITPSRKVIASASRLNVSKRSSQLGVRKSFGGTTLSSHISKTRRSIVSPRKHSPINIGAKLLAKARNSLGAAAANNSRTGSRSGSLVAAAISRATEKKEKSGVLPGAEYKANAELSSANKNEVADLSRTFILDDTFEEKNVKGEDNPEAILKTQNITFSPVKEDSARQADESVLHKKELNTTFSPEKSVSVVESVSRPDITIDVIETDDVAKHEECTEESKEKDKNIITEHISESFAEVVESKEKPKEMHAAQEATIAENVAEETVKTSAPDQSYQQADSTIDSIQHKEIKCISEEDAGEQLNTEVGSDQVIETLDAGEICNIDLVAQTENITLEVEVTSKPAGESQGTADLLEEIEYVLNKSDELQQQLCRDGHTVSSVKEDALELQEVIDELVGTENTNATDNTKGAENLKAEPEAKFSKFEADSEVIENSAQNGTAACSSSSSEPSTSTTMAFNSDPDKANDVTSIDAELLSSASEITSTDLDADSMGTEITSEITSSKFDVYISGNTSVEKAIVTTDEQEAAAKQPVAIEADNTNNSTETNVIPSSEVTSTGLDVPEITAVEVNTSEPESTTGDVKEIPISTEDHEKVVDSNEIEETKDTTLHLIENASSSQKAAVEAEKTKVVESESAISTTAIELQSDEEIIPETVIDEELQTTSTTPPTISNDLEKVTPSKIIAKESNENIEKSVVSVGDALQPTTNISSTVIDSEELLEESTQPKQNSSANETLLNDIKAVAILVPDEKTDIAGETESTTALEVKATNLSGVHDMLRTPKHSETTTSRFIGLRSLMRTPKASTSVAAYEDHDEQLIGIQTLLKTPIDNKRSVKKTPQPATESNNFTPRRSARRRASANAELTPTRCVTPTLPNVAETCTPRRTIRRRASASASATATASAEVSYTPQRITRRRSSLSLDTEEVIAAALTPQKRGGVRAKHAAILGELPVAEDMGAIIEEDLKEDMQEPTYTQQSLVETVKDSAVLESKESVPSSGEVIEESICEEVNTQKQQAEKLEAKIEAEKGNEGSEEKANLITEIELEQLDEQPDVDVKNAETTLDSVVETSARHLKKYENDKKFDENNPKEITTTDETDECLQKTEDIATGETAEKAKILDESDYDYGKELKEEGEENFDTDAQLKTPKTNRKSVRIADTIKTSPKTPVMVGMREMLKTPKASSNTPKLIGIRDLVRTPKSTIASVAMGDDDEERFTGLGDLVKTPKAATQQKSNEDAVSDEEVPEPTTSTADNAPYIGMRELLKTPKHTSTPQYRGMRELLSTPKACSTPQLGGLEELMQTPKRTKLHAQYNDDDDDEENADLDQFFKTPRAKNVMITAEPASAVLEPSSHSTVDIMTATTEYELHSSSHRGLEDIYKTPVSTRLSRIDTIAEDVDESAKKACGINKDEKVAISTTARSDAELVIPETPAPNTSTKRNLSAEEAFEELVGERTVLDETPPRKVYARKRQSIATTSGALSPFSAADIISDLPKTDIQEWVDSLEEGAGEEREVTVTASLLDASKATHDPIATSVCESSSISVCKDTTEQLLADMSEASSMPDPLLPSAAKSARSAKSALQEIADDNDEALRPTTPVESDISGLNFLDQTNESAFSEPLLVSDSESVQDKEENDDEEKEMAMEKIAKSHSEKEASDTNKSMGEEDFPTMFVDSSESESEDTMNANKTVTDDSSAKQAESTTPAVEGIIKNTSDTEVIDLDDSSESIEATPRCHATAEKTTESIDIHTEFRNFQAHKNLARQQLRASTPNRCSKALKPQYTRGRRQSMGAEKLLASASIDLCQEKSRLANEKTSATYDDCIIEVNESIEEPVTVEKVAAELIQPEFSNFQTHKTIATQGKRASTPDQVNKTRTHKVTQGRRLTLGAERHLPDVTIDFLKEKIKLDHANQLPMRIDECILEIEDSENEVENTTSTAEVNVKATDDDVSAAESAIEIVNSTAVTIEGKLKSAQLVEVQEDIVATAELSERVEDAIENVEVNNENENENKEEATVETLGDPTEETVQNIEAEITSTAVVDDVQTAEVGYEAESKIAELDADKPESSTSVEIEGAEGVSTEEVIFIENESEVEIPPIADENKSTEAKADESESTTLNEIEDTYECLATEEVILIENEKDSAIAATMAKSKFSESNAVTISAEIAVVESAIANENVPEIPTTAETSNVKCAPDIPVLAAESREKTSTQENEFNKSDIFDLTDEPPNETTTINTTQGVIFDLTEEEDVEVNIEQQTEEPNPASKADGKTEVSKQRVQDDETIAVEKETVATTELKNKDDDSANAVLTTNEERNAEITTASENGVATPPIAVDIDKAKANAEAPIISAEEIATDIALITNAKSTEKDAHVLGVSMKSAVDGEIREFDAETSQAVILTAVTKSAGKGTTSVKMPKQISDAGNELDETNAAQLLHDTEVVALNASVNADMPEERSESLNMQAQSVVPLEDSVIELVDSDVEEITEEPSADATNEQETVNVSHMPATSEKIENEKKEGIESKAVEQKTTEEIAAMPTIAPTALEIEDSKPPTSEKESNGGEEPGELEANAQLSARDAIEATVQDTHEPEEVTANVSEKAVSAEEVPVKNINDAGDLNEAATSDSKQLPARRVSRKASQSKQPTVEEVQSICKTQLESETLIEENASISGKPQPDASIKRLLEQKTDISTETEGLAETVADAKPQNQSSEKLTEATAQEAVAEVVEECVEELDEAVEASSPKVQNVPAQVYLDAAESVVEVTKSDEETTSVEGQQPAKRKGRKPSRSKQTPEEKEEPLSKEIFENALTEETDQIGSEARSSKANIESKTSTEEFTAVEEEEGPEKKEDLQVLPEAVEKVTKPAEHTSSVVEQQPAKRKERKPSSAIDENALTEESELIGSEAIISKANIESKQLVVESATNEEQTTEKKEVLQDLPEAVENLEKLPKLDEETASVGEQLPAKRKGRKPSRTKQTAEEKEDPKSSNANEEKALAEETKLIAAVEEKVVETVGEELPAKRKGRKPSRSKLTTEEKEKPVSNAILENAVTEQAEEIVSEATNLRELPEVAEKGSNPEGETSSVVEQHPAKRKGRKPSKAIDEETITEESELIGSEATMSKANTTSKTSAEGSAEPEKKEDLHVHIKASFEVLLSTSTEEANVKTENAVGLLTASGSSEKSEIENDPTLLTAKETKPVKDAMPDKIEKKEKAGEATEEATVAIAETDIAVKQENAPTQRPTRRARKGSQSSQCSAQDEEHLPTATTTTRRRGGRRRAETPVEHSADEAAATSDVPAVKRRRGQGRATEDITLEDIQETQVDETENKTENQVVKSTETEDDKKVERESSKHLKFVRNRANDDNDVEKKQLEEAVTNATNTLQDDGKIEDASSNASSAESVLAKVIEDHLVTQKTAAKRGATRRRRGEKVADQAADNEEDTENKNEERNTADELVEDAANEIVYAVDVSTERQQEVGASKRGRRKQTVSESSHNSSTAEPLEPHTTQRRRRGRRLTIEEPVANAFNEEGQTSDTKTLLAEEVGSRKEEEATAIVTVLPTVIEVAESVSSIIADEHMKKDETTIKREKGNEKQEDGEATHAVADTSKRTLTRNKRQLKSSDTSKDNAEVSEVTEHLKEEPKKETPSLEQENPIEETVTKSRTRVSRQKKVETDENHEAKPEEDNEHHKGDEATESENEAKTTETAIEQPSNTANESVGGRRGRRGAAAAATVAINEVSSAHKRGVPRGRLHQSKPQTTQRQEETDETATELMEESSAAEEKKPQKVGRKRRGSTAETQPDHVEADAELTETEDKEAPTKPAVARRARKRRESHHDDVSKKEGNEEATTNAAPASSHSAASTKQRGRRKRKDSLRSTDGGAVGGVGSDEPPMKRPLSRKGRDSSLDSSIHEGAGVEIDATAGGNTSSASTTPQRSRNVPRRAAAAQDRNYDESSDAEAQVDLKRRIEKASLPKTASTSSAATTITSSKHRSPTAGASTAGAVLAAVAELAEIAAKTETTPILSAATTTRGGRQRKPTARVQQYLEEERAKAETPKKRLLLGSVAVGETPTSQARATPARRTRKASTIETEPIEMLHTPARGRARTAKALNVAETSEESRSEVEHTHSELESTHSSSHAEEKRSATTAKVAKRPTRRGKQTKEESGLNEAQQSPAVLTQEAHTVSSRGGRAAKVAAAVALIPDQPTGSHTKARVGRARRGAATAEEDHHTDVETKGTCAEIVTPSVDDEKSNKPARTAAVVGRAKRGGRRNKQQLDEEDSHSHTSQYGLLEDSEASNSSGLQQHQPPQLLVVDADDEHEEEEDLIMITEEEEEDKPLASVKAEKTVGKKRTTSTRKVAVDVSATDSPAPKRGRRRAVNASVEKVDVVNSDNAGSSRNRKVVRFDAAMPSSTASAAILVEAVAEETSTSTKVPAKRATRSRRK